MTVCIAAMYQRDDGHYGIWAISDRRLTDEESLIATEPEMDKSFPVNKRCMLLGAGDNLDDRDLWIAARIAAVSADLAGGMSMRKIVETYRDAYIRARVRLAETTILEPHGLTLDTWTLRQGTMNQAIALDIARRLEERILDVDTLIFGFNPPEPTGIGTGTLAKRPHIYRVGPFGRVTNYDTPGMATIGRGGDVSDAEMSLAGYVPNWGRAAVLRLVYTPKRKAEAVESVGVESDLFEVTEDARNKRNELLPPLGSCYSETIRQLQKAWRRCDAKVGALLATKGAM